MNIFLDTNILYKDPFWKGNFNSELLDAIKEQEINLFVSTVVLKELERNYRKIIDEENVKIRKIIEQVQLYSFSMPRIREINSAKSTKTLLDFYSKLEKDGVLNVLDFDNEMLPEILERAIWRKKPFTESKTELKDAVIWLTYSSYAEKEKLSDCILLTNNVTDFCNTEKLNQNIFEIHPDLAKDSDKFKIYKSPKELIQQEKSKLQVTNQRFENWLLNQNIDESYIKNIILANYKYEIESKIEREYDGSDVSIIFDTYYYMPGYLSVVDFNSENVSDLHIDMFKDECLISGDLFVNCTIEGHEYQPGAERGEEKYKYIGEKDIKVRLVFSFFYDRSKTPRQFDIDHIELTKNP